ncbi:MAG: bifunctional diaminohydroxyphosphoribosylaminopyrimidine deaminase/5-amino-6-(5-phosphoribosylamino)uracil reductase RibD [Dehalococcoidales bacterium]|nr:bifunctional diaminohydroxyphosphoribosylaminopyrimidine deaminase/5-amino-6-(5-phosphoribosylamino)uracil reductase RibD [Dehalococcoidales bacterium]
MDYMEQALSLAKLALGQVSPNPAVGAVIVKNDVIIGKGYTQPTGFSHAEIMALKQAGKEVRGGLLYSTLEPCCHYGHTPPCTGAIIAAGITEVHMAMLDPNPLVNGKGKAELERAGIKVVLGEHIKAAKTINEGYIKFQLTGLPFITVKYAMSLDGKIATYSGDSKWISGEESRHFVHNMRYINDAIMAGVNTVLADDPQLTARCGGGRGGTAKKQPLRIIIDGTGITPKNARIFSEPGKILLVIGRHVEDEEKKAFNKVGAEILELPSINGYIELKKVMEELAKRQITSVLVEGGSILFGSLFDQKLVDKVIIFVAPVIIGGEKAKTAIGGRGAEKIMDAIKLKNISEERFGDDMMVVGYIKE